MSKTAANNQHFEASLAEITQLIEKMEQADLTLEQSLTHFERGIHLIKHCQKVLSDAEQKVQILIENNQREQLTDYEQHDNKNEPHANES
jgi:exodeoxyribonuclease VII small subunit